MSAITEGGKDFEGVGAALEDAVAEGDAFVEFLALELDAGEIFKGDGRGGIFLVGLFDPGFGF